MEVSKLSKQNVEDVIRAKIEDIAFLARSNPSLVETAFQKLKVEFPEYGELIEVEQLFLYERLHRIQDVIGLAEGILKRDPDNYLARLRYARALGMAGRYDESTMEFERLLEIARNRSRKDKEILYAHYAKMLMVAGRYLEATLKLREALEILPHNIQLRTKLAMAFKSAKRYNEALAILRALPQNDPYVRMEMAHVFINMLVPKQAKDHLDAAKRLFMIWRLEDKRLRNRRERESIQRRLEALKVALKAVEGNVEYAEEWFAKNHGRYSAAKLVGVVLDQIRAKSAAN